MALVRRGQGDLITWMIMGITITRVNVWSRYLPIYQVLLTL